MIWSDGERNTLNELAKHQASRAVYKNNPDQIRGNGHFVLGYIIFSSSGFNLDNEELVKKARSHFKKAIQCGHVEAISQLAQTYSNDFGPLYETLHHYMLMGRYYEAKGNSVKADEYYGKGLDCYKSSFDDLAAVYKLLRKCTITAPKKIIIKGQLLRPLLLI